MAPRDAVTCGTHIGRRLAVCSSRDEESDAVCATVRSRFVQRGELRSVGGFEVRASFDEVLQTIDAAPASGSQQRRVELLRRSHGRA